MTLGCKGHVPECETKRSNVCILVGHAWNLSCVVAKALERRMTIFQGGDTESEAEAVGTWHHEVNIPLA